MKMGIVSYVGLVLLFVSNIGCNERDTTQKPVEKSSNLKGIEVYDSISIEMDQSLERLNDQKEKVESVMTEVENEFNF